MKQTKEMTFEEMASEIDALRAGGQGRVEGERAVVVTTSKRGVFFGRTSGSLQDALEATTLDLRGARMCMYWDSSRGGVLGLPEQGPGSACNVGERASGVTELPAEDITSITDCTPAATRAWDDAPVHRG